MREADRQTDRQITRQGREAEERKGEGPCKARQQGQQEGGADRQTAQTQPEAGSQTNSSPDSSVHLRLTWQGRQGTDRQRQGLKTKQKAGRHQMPTLRTLTDTHQVTASRPCPPAAGRGRHMSMAAKVKDRVSHTHSRQQQKESEERPGNTARVPNTDSQAEAAGHTTPTKSWQAGQGRQGTRTAQSSSPREAEAHPAARLGVNPGRSP